LGHDTYFVATVQHFWRSAPSEEIIPNKARA
jgi:hypothetical protein